MKRVIRTIFAIVLINISTSNFAASIPSNATITVNNNLKGQPSVIPTTDNNSITKFLAGDFSGSFDLTNNYMFRGISQSNNNPAVQGGLNYTLKTTGIHFNVWGSNVDFLDAQGNRATVELDTSFGIANPIGPDFSYDLYFDRYNYPRASGASYNEIFAIANYRFLTGTIAYSSNAYSTHKTSTYYEVGIHYDIPAKYIYFEDMRLQTAIGYYDLPKSPGISSYTNYSASINKSISNYVLSLGWTDTDGNAHQGSLGGSHFVAMVAAYF